MTSPRFNERRAHAKAEMAVFDSLPKAVRDAIAKAPGSVRASVVLATLLRGVPEEQVIATLLKEPRK